MYVVAQQLSVEYSARRRLRRRQAEAAATKTVSALLPRLHVENASAMRPVDALRARLATTSRVRRYQSACAGYGIPLDQQSGRPPRRSSAPEPRMPRLG